MKARHWIPPQKQKPKNSQVELWKAMKEAEVDEKRNLHEKQVDDPKDLHKEP